MGRLVERAPGGAQALVSSATIVNTRLHEVCLMA
jgi:hypothetical protein